MSKLISNELSSYVLDELDKQGLSVDREVELVRPVLPDDITMLGDEDLMLLYTQFSAYLDFIGTQLACATTDEKELDRQIDYEESAGLIRLQGLSPKATITVIKAQVDTTPEIVELKKQRMEKYAYRKMLETMFSNYERGSMLCSRELTRRTAGDTFKTRTRKLTI